MRQVPNYLLIGNGRVARHFQHYFSLLQLPYQTWHRHEPDTKLTQQLESATHVLLLISDRAIAAFAADGKISTTLFCDRSRCSSVQYFIARFV
jgi:hypothetical protein